jgi:hypothetical protein
MVELVRKPLARRAVPPEVTGPTRGRKHCRVSAGDRPVVPTQNLDPDVLMMPPRGLASLRCGRAFGVRRKSRASFSNAVPPAVAGDFHDSKSTAEKMTERLPWRPPVTTRSMVRDQVLRNHNYSHRIRQIEIGPGGMKNFRSLHYLAIPVCKYPGRDLTLRSVSGRNRGVLKVKRKFRFSLRCPLTPSS